MEMRSKKLVGCITMQSVTSLSPLSLSLSLSLETSDLVTVNIITHLLLHDATADTLHWATNSFGLKGTFLHLVFLLLQLHHVNTFLLLPGCYLPALRLGELFPHFLHPKFAFHHFLPL